MVGGNNPIFRSYEVRATSQQSGRHCCRYSRKRKLIQLDTALDGARIGAKKNTEAVLLERDGKLRYRYKFRGSLVVGLCLGEIKLRGIPRFSPAPYDLQRARSRGNGGAQNCKPSIEGA